MASLATEIKQRMAAVRDVAKAVKQVVTSLNKISRLCRQIQNRKKTLPDEKDLQRLLTLMSEGVKAVSALSSIPGKLSDVWVF